MNYGVRVRKKRLLTVEMEFVWLKNPLMFPVSAVLVIQGPRTVGALSIW